MANPQWCAVQQRSELLLDHVGRSYTEVTRVFPTTRHPLDAVFPMPPGVIWVRTEALRRRLVLQRKPMTAVTELPSVSTPPYRHRFRCYLGHQMEVFLHQRGQFLPIVF